jgi:hypothetical protein
MAWFMATANAYDVMGDVFITVEVRSQGESPERPVETVLRATTTISGVGETNPRDWLEDILVACLESL